MRGPHKDSVTCADGVRTGDPTAAPPALPVLWDELQGLRDLVLSLKAVAVEQRQALRSVESRLRDGELEAERQRRSVDALQETAGRQTRSVDALQAWPLSVNEKQLEDLKTENSVQSEQLSSLESRLNITHKNTLKVAFSAGLTDSGAVGPFDTETTLTFSKTISNIGRAYNQTAGVFTAPVRGLYFFSFTAADYLKGYMGLYLYRNNQPILFNLDLNDHGGYASTSNAIALQLEEGDKVRLSLPASYRLYDDSRNFSVFSGFLLFAL
uniref:C1q domain-containing protein n=1 Tax=Sander lucioperca TaxID=283035 RepID=A0A8D0A884_SANLU